MKKNKTKGQEQKPRRLSLNRETIRALNDPALLELVRGRDRVAPTGSDLCCPTGSESVG